MLRVNFNKKYWKERRKICPHSRSAPLLTFRTQSRGICSATSWLEQLGWPYFAPPKPNTISRPPRPSSSPEMDDAQYFGATNERVRRDLVIHSAFSTRWLLVHANLRLTRCGSVVVEEARQWWNGLSYRQTGSRCCYRANSEFAFWFSFPLVFFGCLSRAQGWWVVL